MELFIGIGIGILAGGGVIWAWLSVLNKKRIEEVNAKTDLALQESKLTAKRLIDEAEMKAEKIVSKAEATNESIKQKKIQEAREKFSRVRPRDLSQAGRISGITPADLAVLTLYLK